MDAKNTLIRGLKKQGFRFTKVRSVLIDIFFTNSQPISVSEIINQLRKMNIKVNKTSVYRQLDFLLEHELIRQIDLRERGRKFEYNLKSHHHHLVCIRCKKIDDFELEHDLSMQEKKILLSKGFSVLNHSLEFFGLCLKCKDSNN